MNILCKVFLCTPRIDPRDSVRILVEETLRSICEETCGPRAFPLKVQTRLAHGAGFILFFTLTIFLSSRQPIAICDRTALSSPGSMAIGESCCGEDINGFNDSFSPSIFGSVILVKHFTPFVLLKQYIYIIFSKKEKGFRRM